MDNVLSTSPVVFEVVAYTLLHFPFLCGKCKPFASIDGSLQGRFGGCDRSERPSVHDAMNSFYPSGIGLCGLGLVFYARSEAIQESADLVSSAPVLSLQSAIKALQEQARAGKGLSMFVVTTGKISGGSPPSYFVPSNFLCAELFQVHSVGTADSGLRSAGGGRCSPQHHIHPLGGTKNLPRAVLSSTVELTGDVCRRDSLVCSAANPLPS